MTHSTKVTENSTVRSARESRGGLTEKLNALVGRLRIGQQFAVVVTALMLPIVILAVVIIQSTWAEVTFTKGELEGMKFLAETRNLAEPVVEYAYAATEQKKEGKSNSAAVADAERRVNVALAALEAHVAGTNDAMGLGATLQGFKSQWLAAPGKIAPLTVDEDIAQVGIDLLDGVLTLNDAIADKSGLVLDPDDKTFYYMNVLTSDFPRVVNRVAEARVATAHIPAQAPVGIERDFVVTTYHVLQLEVKELVGHIAEIRDHGPAHADDMQRAFDSLAAANKPLIDALASHADNGGDVAQLRSLAAEAASKTMAGLDVAIQAATQGYEEHLSDRKSHLITIVAGNVALVLCAMLLAFFIRGRIVGSLHRAVAVSKAIGEGKLDNDIVVNTRDEIGELLQSMGDTQQQLRDSRDAERANAERERVVAAVNGRIKQALDAVSANVMVADKDHNIIYMNPALKRMFTEAQGEMRKALPGFDVERLEGQSTDLFHRSSAHQRQMIEAMRSSTTTNFKVGTLSIRVTHTPVFDAEGHRLGTALEWINRTQEVAVEQEIENIVEGALEGDLTNRIRKEGKSGFFEVLAVGMNSLLDNFGELVGKIKVAAAEVHGGAEEISKGNTSLSQRTEEQASSLEETASSMEEMTSTVKQTADNAAQANQLASAARAQAEKGGAVVGSAITAMSAINSSSRKIADIIGVIDEIAFQTNLLALNAAVEAARAGEQGRGFAVVASEVRNLAGRSATAAKEIKALIQDSVGKVEDGSKLVDQSGQTLGEIVLAVKKVSDIVAEIAAASQEQSSGIEQVNRAVVQMDEVTQQNAALVEEAAAAAETIVEQAQGLNQIVARYNVTTGEQSTSMAAAKRFPPRVASRPTAANVATLERRGPTRTPGRAAGAGPSPIARVAAAASANTDWHEF